MESISLLSRNSSVSSVKLERIVSALEFNLLRFAEYLRRTTDIFAAARDEMSCNWLSSMVRQRMLVRSYKASRDVEIRPLPDISNFSNLLAIAENASAGNAPRLLSSNLRHFMFGKFFKPDTSVSLRS